MERRLPQRFEHLPHSLLNNPIDHVGNSQPALPAPRLGNEHPADPARLIPPRKQVGLQPGQNDRPLICQRLDRLPVRTRSALVRRHLQQRIRQPVRNLLHRRRRCTPNLADRLRRSRPDLPQPVPGSPAGSPSRVFCCRDRQTELHRRFFDRDRLPLPTGTRPGTLNGHYTRLPVLRGPRTSAGPSSRRPLVLRPTSQKTLAGTQQISWGETLRFRRDGVATTPSGSTGIGHRRRWPARPPRNALRRFTFVRDHDAPMASFSPALTEAPAAHNQAALGTARSIPSRALASSVLDSPYQGSRTGLTPPISTSVPSTPAPRPPGSAPRRRSLSH